MKLVGAYAIATVVIPKENELNLEVLGHCKARVGSFEKEKEVIFSEENDIIK